MSTMYGMGWLRDLPDFRDYTPKLEKVQALRAGLLRGPAAPPPPSVDLSKYFPPIEDQGQLGSCTANAGVGLVEYYERRACGQHVDASRLFLYKATRNLLKMTGDTGAYLRSMMGALVLFGAPPEEYWPYDVANFDEEPSAFLYAFADNYKAIQYYRLDPPGMTPADLLAKIKSDLASGLPSVFGFTVYSSYRQAESDGGKIPFPMPSEGTVGGHAVVAAGYDDNKKILNLGPGAVETTGAIMIRNSWGTGWGDGGYGWLPYDYVLKGLAVDWWTIIKAEWVATGPFSE